MLPAPATLRFEFAGLSGAECEFGKRVYDPILVEKGMLLLGAGYVGSYNVRS